MILGSGGSLQIVILGCEVGWVIVWLSKGAAEVMWMWREGRKAKREIGKSVLLSFSLSLGWFGVAEFMVISYA